MSSIYSISIFAENETPEDMSSVLINNAPLSLADKKSISLEFDKVIEDLTQQLEKLKSGSRLISNVYVTIDKK